MIIKSMTRKTPSFRQLGEYMNSNNEGSEFNIYSNLYSGSPESIYSQFTQNAEYIKARKNGVYMYHEIISFTKGSKEVDRNRVKEAVEEYIKRRSPDSMVYGVLHNDAKHHLHYHLLISANKKHDNKKQRLTKQQFDKLKKDFESFVLASYPDLEQELVIGRETPRDKPARSNKGGELKRRAGKKPKTEETREKFQKIIDQSKTKEDFFRAISEANFEFYFRGSTFGLKNKSSGYKYRLATLGLEAEFFALSEKFEAETKTREPEKPLEPRSTTKQEQTKAKTPKQAERQERAMFKEAARAFKEFVLGNSEDREAEDKIPIHNHEQNARREVRLEKAKVAEAKQNKETERQQERERAKEEAKAQFERARKQDRDNSKDRDR